MQYAQMLRQAEIEYGDSELGEEFASQLLCDKAVVAAGRFLLDSKKYIYSKEWLASPAILKLPAQTTSPKKCATEEHVHVEDIHIRSEEGSISLSIVPLNLESDNGSQAKGAGQAHQVEDSSCIYIMQLVDW